MLIDMVLKSGVAGILAALACGLGVLPLAWRRLDLKRHTGLAYAFAGGLMFSASVYNLLLPGLTLNSHTMKLSAVLPVVAGMLAGGVFLWLTDRFLSPERLASAGWKKWGSRTEILVFIAMFVHSIPEGVAVGVGFASQAVQQTDLGYYIALAIAIHNIPEGLAVAIPMRASGASLFRAFWAATLTSIPQPIAAVPAALLAWFFQPLMPFLMGFAAGAMIFLVLLELIPDALETTRPVSIAWSFMFGFCLMLLIQVAL